MILLFTNPSPFTLPLPVTFMAGEKLLQTVLTPPTLWHQTCAGQAVKLNKLHLAPGKVATIQPDKLSLLLSVPSYLPAIISWKVLVEAIMAGKLEPDDMLSATWTKSIKMTVQGWP